MPVANQVIIKPNRGESEYILPSGMKLQLDISYEREMHAPVTGTVIMPPKTIFGARRDFPGLQWEVDMEIQKRDVVAYSYLAAMNAMEVEEGKIIMCDGEAHFMVPYDECFVAKRPAYWRNNMIFKAAGAAPEITMQAETLNGGPPVTKFDEQIIPLNGYCLVEPVEQKTVHRLGGLELESVAASIRTSAVFGRVVYASKSLIKNYLDGDGLPDVDEVRPGDYIAFDRGCDLLCEYDMHASIEGKKKFYRIQRRYMRAIVPESMITAS